MAHKILEEAQEINDLLIKWRRDLHQIPETDLELPKTVEYISKRLDEMNVEYKVFPEVSVIIAQIGKGDKCFLLRSDMDALPVEEETGLEFASKNGCMHGCGHTKKNCRAWSNYCSSQVRRPSAERKQQWKQESWRIRM